MDIGTISREESAWHAGDVRGPARNLRGVLIDGELYGVHGIEPCVSGTRSPRLGASYAQLQETVEDEMAYYAHRSSPAYQDPDRRGWAQVTRNYKTRSRMKWLTFLRF